jgi:hypothetical protein
VSHPDDQFHPPTNDDAFWSETAWFAFSVPERKLAGWTYPFFRPNQGVCSAAVFLWDDTGELPFNCRYYKQFWHLPLPERLDDFELPNGLGYTVQEPRRVYELRYRDPDADDISFNLTFTAIMDPLLTKTSSANGGHYDQLGRFTGTLVLDGETIEVDSYGARDRSWGARTPFGPYLMSAGEWTATEMPYSHATSDEVSFLTITANVTDDYPVIMGFHLRDGEVSRISTGRRAILERDPATDTVKRVMVEGTDELGREFHAEGETLTRFVNFCNENLVGWNYLVRWEIDGVEAWGEQHENFSTGAFRKYLRSHPGSRHA